MDAESVCASTSTDSAKKLNSTDRETSTNSQSSSTQYVWSDKKCINIAFEKSFPKAVKNLAVQKNIITRFFNFYLGAKVHKQKGVSVNDLVFSVISITPLHQKTEQFMWDDDHYDDKGSLFSLALEDNLSLMTGNQEANKTTGPQNKEEILNTKKGDIKNNQQFLDNANIIRDEVAFKENKIEKYDLEPSHSKSDIKHTENLRKTKADNLKSVENDATKQQETNKTLPKQEEEYKPKVNLKFPKNDDIVWFTQKLASPSANAEYKQYGPVENAAFTASVNKFLELWDSSQEARIDLKYFFGFAALTLLRGTTKTFKHLVNAFANVKYISHLNRMSAFLFEQLKYSVPHKRCIKCCYRTFRKRDENMRVMFAKVVINSFFIEAKLREAGPVGPIRLNIIKIAVLNHTAGYGLGLISMVENLAKRAEDIPSLVELTRCKETEPYWEKLITFFETYMTAAANEHTHHWARVIDGNYFKALSCAENYPLAVILAVFLDKLSGGHEAGIWQSTWITKGENLDHYKSVGVNLFLQYRKRGFTARTTDRGTENKQNTYKRVVRAEKKLELLLLLQEVSKNLGFDTLPGEDFTFSFNDL